MGNKATADAKPSTFSAAYWIFAYRHDYTNDGRSGNTGKWLLFPSTDEADEWWRVVAAATMKGDLGIAAKVSTALPNGPSWSPNERVICIYTSDWTDANDVRRVGEAISKLGLSKDARYKADIDTLDGRYAVSGSKRISKYTLKDGKIYEGSV